MRARILFWTACCVGAVPAALAVMSLPGVAAVGVLFGIVAGFATAGALTGERRDGRDVDGRTVRRAATIVCCAVAGGWAVLTGMVLVLGSASVAVLLFLAGAAMVWVRARRHGPGGGAPGLRRAATDRLLRAARSDRPRTVHDDVRPAAAPSSLEHLTTPELCRAWQHSYFALLDLPAGVPRTALAQLRGQMLDELERRDPDGFTRWLDTDGRAGGNPSRFLGSDR